MDMQELRCDKCRTLIGYTDTVLGDNDFICMRCCDEITEAVKQLSAELLKPANEESKPS